MGEKLICSKCGDEFDEENGRRAGKMNYCGYCEAVVFGDSGEPTWPPKVTGQELRELRQIRGIHITRTP